MKTRENSIAPFRHLLPILGQTKSFLDYPLLSLMRRLGEKLLTDVQMV